MKYRVLGCSGGEAPGFRLPSFLVEERLLIDTGSVAMALEVTQQAGIDHILLTHSHLDHTGGLPHLADNILGTRSTPVQVHGIPPTLDGVRSNLLNDVLWPDFTRIPSSAFPTLVYRGVPEGVPFELAGFTITAIRVNHAVECVAYFVEMGGRTLLHVGDTGPTDAVWRHARGVPDLVGICIETTFPNRLQEIADYSGHLTPRSLEKELDKLDRDVPVYVYHLKPALRAEILAELKRVRRQALHVLEEGTLYRF
ncbi:MAG: 3',5'-cyclic-nucleotide phosphodiesterase [candidate division NC10 bacterium]|nr:3',5'-cyclic-nucleotide phosphodiesterase [candidate division NC10 bacterium]